MNFAKRYFVVILLTAYPCSCYVFNQYIYLVLCFLLVYNFTICAFVAREYLYSPALLIAIL